MSTGEILAAIVTGLAVPVVLYSVSKKEQTRKEAARTLGSARNCFVHAVDAALPLFEPRLGYTEIPARNDPQLRQQKGVARALVDTKIRELREAEPTASDFLIQAEEVFTLFGRLAFELNDGGETGRRVAVAVMLEKLKKLI
jgi:hypothetical protein